MYVFQNQMPKFVLRLERQFALVFIAVCALFYNGQKFMTDKYTFSKKPMYKRYWHISTIESPFINLKNSASSGTLQ